MDNYVYKIKSKFLKQKNPLIKYGFNLYCDENGEKTVYAIGIKIPINSTVVKYIIKELETSYNKYVLSEDKEKIKEHFDNNGKIILSDETQKELTECQLCFYANDNTLFVNAPNGYEYANVEILNECCQAIIKNLLKDKIIYARKYI